MNVCFTSVFFSLFFFFFSLVLTHVRQEFLFGVFQGDFFELIGEECYDFSGNYNDFSHKINSSTSLIHTFVSRSLFLDRTE